MISSCLKIVQICILLLFISCSNDPLKKTLHQYKSFPGLFSFDIALIYGPSVYASNLRTGRLPDDFRYMKIKRGVTVPVFNSFFNMPHVSIEQPRILPEGTCIKINGKVMVDSVTFLAIEYYDGDTLRYGYLPAKMTSLKTDSCQFASSLRIDSLYIDQVNVFYSVLKKSVQVKEASKRIDIHFLSNDKTYFKLPYTVKLTKDVKTTVFAPKAYKPFVDSLAAFYLSNSGFDKTILQGNSLTR
jgi:hypothetical protein